MHATLPGPRHFRSVAEMRAAVGETLGPSRWVTVAQDRVDAFADTTGDHQWIHVDVERARFGPYGGAIVHGYLTLSLVASLAPDLYKIDNLTIGLNYGMDRLRFPTVVPVGSRIRATATILEASDVTLGVDSAVRFIMRFVIEVEGSEKPGCTADVIYVFG